MKTPLIPISFGELFDKLTILQIKLTKWIRLYQNPNYKPPTSKQLEKIKIREQKIMKELYESDFHKITWDKNVFN